MQYYNACVRLDLSSEGVALCCRSVSGVDADPDLVHMEMQDSSGGKRPVVLWPGRGFNGGLQMDGCMDG